MDEKGASAGRGGFLALAERRYSCRSYKKDPVARSLLEQVIEAARLAPSACNRQPWRFVVATDLAVRGRLVSDGLLPGLGMHWAAEAPVILVLGIEKSFIAHRVAPRISGVDYPLVDLGIAGEHAVLQATELGLGTCWIGWIRPDDVRRIVGWPEAVVPQALITLGWPAQAPASRRPRKEPGEIVSWM